MPHPKFALGQIVATPGAIVALEFNGISALSLLQRHYRGDYGELCEEDKQANEFAIVNGERILSVYTLADGQRLYIVTERDRSVTTILAVDEY